MIAPIIVDTMILRNADRSGTDSGVVKKCIAVAMGINAHGAQITTIMLDDRNKQCNGNVDNISCGHPRSAGGIST
ncbi:MAG: hypothetical protein LBI69_01865 [Puniceicoccales bacterium]|nr:hypothetical protein [Puniceicoccales bacterium]